MALARIPKTNNLNPAFSVLVGAFTLTTFRLMALIRNYFWTLLVLLPLVLPAQNKPKATGTLSPEVLEQLRLQEDTLVILSYAVVNDSLADLRFLACRSLIKALVRTLKVENSFLYPFDRLKSVSILAPPDSSFRIFTWQLFVDDSTYRYYGAIQLNERELNLFPLIDRSFDMPGMPVRETMSPDQWYGALYYNIMPFDTREGRKYLLFGFDAYSFFDRRKVLEVLGFDREGKPYFGASVFDRGDGPTEEKRLILEYFAEAGVRLNWDPQYELILMDHLIPFANPYTGGVMYVPDGSYDGLKLEKGRWKYIDKVFNDVQEEAPRPEPVLDKERERNIVGEKGKPKKTKN